MKNKRTAPLKPRNRESKKRGTGMAAVSECRHMWMDGICMKCGISYSEAQPTQKNNCGGQHETK